MTEAFLLPVRIQAAPKSNPPRKNSISLEGIFTKFARLTDEDSFHVNSKFY